MAGAAVLTVTLVETLALVLVGVRADGNGDGSQNRVSCGSGGNCSTQP